MNFSTACVLGLALGLASLPAPAQEPEPGADFTLESLLETMTTSSGFSAEFAERKELALLSVPLESRGRLYFVPPDRFARFTTQPEFTALVIDGEHVRFREGADGDELDLSANPLTRAFVDNFLVLWSGSSNSTQRSCESKASAGNSPSCRVTRRSVASSKPSCCAAEATSSSRWSYVTGTETAP